MTRWLTSQMRNLQHAILRAFPILRALLQPEFFRLLMACEHRPRSAVDSASAGAAVKTEVRTQV